MGIYLLQSNREVEVLHKPLYLKDLVQEEQKHFNGRIVLAEVNGRLRELTQEVKDGDRISWLDTTTPDGYRTLQRGLSFLLIRALKQILIEEKREEYEVIVHFSLNQGFYCELQSTQGNYELLKVDADLLAKTEKQMKDYISRDLPFAKQQIKTKKAARLFEQQKLESKARLIKYRRASETNVYELDDYVDYFYGYMVPSAGYLSDFSLHLYEQGLVLQFPERSKPEQAAGFDPDTKLFQTLKKVTDWGRLIHVENAAELNQMIENGRMKDLILVTEALMEKTIAEIGSQIAANVDQKKFVFIAGPSSSGKTTFAHRLSIQLLANGIRGKIISVDDYFVNREDTPRDEQGNYDFETIQAIDVKQFNQDMAALLAGQKVKLPRFDFVTGLRGYDENPTELHQNEILIIEGIHCLNDELSYALPKENKYKIYISALTQLNLDVHNRIPSADGRCIRRMVRDFQYRGVSAEKTILMWNSVRRGEEKYIFPYQESADFMFNSAHIYELAILKQYADPLLFHIPESSPAYNEARRLLKFLDYFLGYGSENIPQNSILREFIGGSIFRGE
ncbi:nucleoside kinase [Clostridiales bacterium COT073_COT-073]|nr:nucleoside kinase [Clostridiales bacterium COT073_COT-073]